MCVHIFLYYAAKYLKGLNISEVSSGFEQATGLISLKIIKRKQKFLFLEIREADIKCKRMFTWLCSGATDLLFC